MRNTDHPCSAFPSSGQVHYLQEPAADYVRAAVSAAVDIHKVDLPGDILVFLTGQVRAFVAVKAANINMPTTVLL